MTRLLVLLTVVAGMVSAQSPNFVSLTVSGGGSLLNVNPNCGSGASACNVDLGNNQIAQITSAQTATAPSANAGSGVFTFVATPGNPCQVYGPVSLSLSTGQCSYIGNTLPVGYKPLMTAAYSGGSWGTIVNLQPSSGTIVNITSTAGTLNCGAASEATNCEVNTSVFPQGSGTPNYVPSWTGNNSLGNSEIQDTGSAVGIGGAPDAGYKFSVIGSVSGGDVYQGVHNKDTSNTGAAHLFALVNGGAAYGGMDVYGNASPVYPGWTLFHASGSVAFEPGNTVLLKADNSDKHNKFYGPAPTLATCGSGPSLGSGAVDNAGTINIGSGTVTSCTLNFANAWTDHTPACTISISSTSVASDVASVNATSVTFGFSASLGRGQVYYQCF